MWPLLLLNEVLKEANCSNVSERALIRGFDFRPSWKKMELIPNEKILPVIHRRLLELKIR